MRRRLRASAMLGPAGCVLASTGWMIRAWPLQELDIDILAKANIVMLSIHHIPPLLYKKELNSESFMNLLYYDEFANYSLSQVNIVVCSSVRTSKFAYCLILKRANI